MPLTTQEIQKRFEKNQQNRLNDGALIAELSEQNPTDVLRVLNQFTQNTRARIEAKAREIAEANGLNPQMLINRRQQEFATSFAFMDDCQKAANILESIAALPAEVDMRNFLFKYSQLRKDYDAIIDLMIIDAF